VKKEKQELETSVKDLNKQMLEIKEKLDATNGELTELKKLEQEFNQVNYNQLKQH